MANPFPIGPQQQITYNGRNILIQSCDFNANELSGVGYAKTKAQDANLILKRNITGNPAITGTRYPTRYEFEWSLQLSYANVLTLDAIYQDQKTAYRSFSASPEVRLVDERLAHLESTIPSRQRARASVPTTSITPPTGYTFIYPLFNILITEFEVTPYLINNDLWLVSMKASETSVVPISEDLV